MEWTDTEIQRLKELQSSGKKWVEIGEALNRTEMSVRKKFYSLEKPKEETKEITPCNRYPRVYLKGCVFDIETTAFTAGGVQDHLICASFLPLDGDEVITLQIEWADNRDDRRLLEKVRTEIEKYDVLSGHYVLGFDIPFLNSRLAYHGMAHISRKILVYDTYSAARRSCIKSERRSLAFLSDFFKLKNEKTSIYPVAWQNIDSSDRKEFEYARAQITEHCAGDVRMTRDLFDCLWAIDRSMVSLPVYKK